MTEQEFIENYDQAPYELYEFADAAAGVEDNDELATAANRYLEARETFENLLTNIIEIG